MPLNKILITIVASIISGCLYRWGGSDWGNTKIRDLGCPTIAIGLLLYLYPHYDWKILLSYFLTFGLYFGSMTTYWKKKGEDARWWNWLLTGLGYSLAFLPFAFASGLWLGFALRCVICSIGIMIWSEKIGWDIAEETGRGFISTITLPLLLIQILDFFYSYVIIQNN